MTRIFTAIIVLFSLMGQAYAWDDLCATVGPAVKYTTAKLDEFSDKRIVQKGFQGSGRVKDVRSGGLASKFTVIVDCGNDVFAEVPTSSQRASQNLQIGEPISFSGTANGVYRKRYVNTHSYYLQISFNDNSSVW